HKATRCAASGHVVCGGEPVGGQVYGAEQPVPHDERPGEVRVHRLRLAAVVPYTGLTSTYRSGPHVHGTPVCVTTMNATTTGMALTTAAGLPHHRPTATANAAPRGSARGATGRAQGPAGRGGADRRSRASSSIPRR